MKPDVAEPIKLHSWSFERQTPGYCSNIRGEAHRPQHFGPENAAVADLNPLVQTLNVRKYFHRWLRVRVVGRFKPDGGHAKSLEELLEHTDEVAKAYVSVNDDSFDLMELCQVCFVNTLIAKYSVNAEIFSGCESTKAKSTKNPAGNSSRVCA